MGTNGDPCFGIEYDLSTKECKLCGDSEPVSYTHLDVYKRQGVHRKKIYNSVSGIIDLDLKVKYPYLERIYLILIKII